MSNQNNITFVLGAGASSEVGLPDGNELKEKISNLVEFKYSDITHQPRKANILEAIQSITGKFTQQTNFGICNIIIEAIPLSKSIDYLIDAHRGNTKLEKIAKTAITQAILYTEGQSSLFKSNHSQSESSIFQGIKDTWFAKFFRLIVENCQREDLPKRLSRIKIISFNYDRCLAHFMYHALQTYYNIEGAEAKEILQKLEIFHPYGRVGRLPWQYGDDPAIKFGGNPTADHLIDISSQIRTFTEGVDSENSEIDNIRKSIFQATRLIFLGFAFHDMNMKLLLENTNKTSNETNRVARIFGTAKGISDSDCSLIQRNLSKKINPKLELGLQYVKIDNHLTCSQLFDEYSRSIKIE